MQPPFSIVKKEAGFMSGVSGGNTHNGNGNFSSAGNTATSHMAKASTADESSGPNSDTNTAAQRSFHSLTQSLYNQAVAKGLLSEPTTTS